MEDLTTPPVQSATHNDSRYGGKAFLTQSSIAIFCCQLNRLSFAVAGCAVLLWLIGLPELAGLCLLAAIVLSVLYHLK